MEYSDNSDDSIPHGKRLVPCARVYEPEIDWTQKLISEYPGDMPRAGDRTLRTTIDTPFIPSTYQRSNPRVFAQNIYDSFVGLQKFLQDFLDKRPQGKGSEYELDNRLRRQFNALISIAGGCLHDLRYGDVSNTVLPLPLNVSLHLINTDKSGPGQTGLDKQAPEHMLKNLKHMEKTLLAICQFPIPLRVPASDFIVIDTFRAAIRRDMLPQLREAIQMENNLQHTLEGMMPEGVSPESRDLAKFQTRVDTRIADIGRWRSSKPNGNEL